VRQDAERRVRVTGAVGAREGGLRGGVNVVFCGENNRFLSDQIDPRVLRDLLTSDRDAATNE